MFIKAFTITATDEAHILRIFFNTGSNCTVHIYNIWWLICYMSAYVYITLTNGIHFIMLKLTVIYTIWAHMMLSDFLSPFILLLYIYVALNYYMARMPFSYTSIYLMVPYRIIKFQLSTIRRSFNNLGSVNFTFTDNAQQREYQFRFSLRSASLGCNFSSIRLIIV